ncbi:MAG: IPT/TIG domain-containing protein [Syntrophothermus sp.]
MKKILYTLNAVLLLSLFIVFQGCSEDPQPSIYDLVGGSNPAPVVNSVSPTQAFAVVTPITITGENFSPDINKNKVYFNGIPGKVISATTTQLVVESANVISDSVKVKVQVSGSDDFSNIINYKLVPALSEITKADGSELFTSNNIPYGITTDAQGNVYTSIVENGVGKGIRKILPSGELILSGEMVDFAPKGGETFFTRMNMWQNNTIIAVRRVNAIFQVTQGVASKVFTTLGLTAQTPMYDIEFDQNQNLWAGGKGLFRYKTTPAIEVKNFNYANEIKALRVYNNALYLLTTVDGNDVIRKHQIISADEIGAAEEVFNIGNSVLPDTGSAKVTASDFEIAADGDIIIGTTRNTDPIIVVHQDGTFASLYPGLIPAGTVVYAFDWAPASQYLYFTRLATTGTQTIFRISMQKDGAVHYGR